jgi:hypothetical protein
MASGIEVRAIITMASDHGELDGKAKQKTIDMIAQHLKSGLTLNAQESLATSSNPFAWIARQVDHY